MSSPQSPAQPSESSSAPTDDAIRPLELARHSGVSVETLRYYERLGLLEEPGRSPGGHRRYRPEALERMQMIKAIHRLGYGLPEVAELFAAARTSPVGDPDATRTENALLDVESKISALEQIRTALGAVPDQHTSLPHGQRPEIPLLALLRHDTSQTTDLTRSS